MQMPVMSAPPQECLTQSGPYQRSCGVSLVFQISIDGTVDAEGAQAAVLVRALDRHLLAVVGHAMEVVVVVVSRPADERGIHAVLQHTPVIGKYTVWKSVRWT